MAITHVQGIIVATTMNASLKASATLSAAVGSGNTLVGSFEAVPNGVAVTSILDDKNNSYTTKDTIDDAADSFRMVQFVLGNITNGPITITITFGVGATNGNPVTIILDEYSGVAALTDPTDGHAGVLRSAPGTGTDAITSPNITTTVNGDLIWGSCYDDNALTPAPSSGTGFTQRETNTGTNIACSSEDKIQAAAGSVNTTFTSTNGGDNFIAFVMALQPAASSAAAPVLAQPIRFNPFVKAPFLSRLQPTAPAQRPFFQTDWPLPINPEPYPYRSWTYSRNPGLIGQDVLPPRQLDWPVPASFEPDWRRSWTYSFSPNLVGKDKLPPRQLDWPLQPTGPEPDFRRSWTYSRNPGLAGKDVLPPRQLDWPLPVAPEPDWRRSWTWRSDLNLIGKDQLPPRQLDWPLPASPEPYPYRSWTLDLLQSTLAPVLTKPFNQLDWPLPVNPEPWPYRTWTYSFNPGLIGQDQLPPRQLDWPLPPTGYEPDWRRSWTWAFPLSLIGQDQLPPRQLDWPVPSGPEPDWRRSWTLNLLLSTLAPVITIPFRQLDWPLPVSPEPYPYRSWTYSPNLNLIGKDQLPPRQLDWPLPASPEPYPYRSWAYSFSPNLIGQDQLPPRQLDWPLPVAIDPWRMGPVIPNLTILLPPPVPPTTQPVFARYFAGKSFGGMTVIPGEVPS